MDGNGVLDGRMRQIHETHRPIPVIQKQWKESGMLLRNVEVLNAVVSANHKQKWHSCVESGILRDLAKGFETHLSEKQH
jgi:hypothetical protein